MTEFRNNGDGTFTYVVTDPEERTKHFGVAAWYETVTLEAGEYPVRLTRIGFSDPAEGDRPYWALVSIPCRTTYRFMPSLFGGNPTGGGPIGAVDEQSTYGVQAGYYTLPGDLIEYRTA